MPTARITPSAPVRRALWILAALLAVFTVTGFFILPPIVRTQLEKRLSAGLGRTVTVGNVRVNPYAFSVTIEGFDVSEKGSPQSFVGCKSLHVNFGLFASLAGEWVINDVALDGLHARVIVNPDGTLNFSDILEKYLPDTPPSTAAMPAKPPRPLHVGRLAITGARVEFFDHARTKPFQTIIDPVTFVLTHFHTAGGAGAPYQFEATSEAGEKLSWTGSLSANPVRSSGTFAVENVALPKYAPYFENAVQANVTNGKLELHGRYEIDLEETNRVLKLTGGKVSVKNFQVVERASNQRAAAISTLEIAGIDADGVADKANVESIRLQGGGLTVRRDKDGTINLLALLRTDKSVPGRPAPTGAKAAKFEATVGEFALQDFDIDVNDLAAPRPVRFALNGLRLSIKNVSTSSAAPMPVQLSFQSLPQGTVSVQGTVTLRPSIAADLSFDAANFPILPLSPYLEEFVNARIIQGTVSTHGSATLSLAEPSPSLTLSADANIGKLGLIDAVRSEQLAGFSSLALNGLKVATAPQLSVSLAEAVVAGPYARVVIEKDGRLNLAGLASHAASAGAQPAAEAFPPAPAPAQPVSMTIGRVVVSDGDFRYADRSIEPNVTLTVDRFGGQLSGLSTASPSRADVDLKAMIGGVGAATISGKIAPLGGNPYADIKIACKSVDLLPLSPYSGKFAGYEIARGSLSFDIAAKVADHQIDMSNVVTLSQFTFGDPVSSPDATKLPVRLGVALLKDSNGEIVMDLPVQGNLADPNFRVGKVIVRVVVNLLAKAAVSPFSLIGSMFGGGGEELSYQDFSPGSAVLEESERGKLTTLMKVLANRPGLSVDIQGSYDAAADGYALKRQKLADLIRQRIWEERRAKDSTIAPPEQITITDAEHLAMLKTLFDAKFQPGSTFGTPLPQPPAVVPPPPQPRPGPIKRIVDYIKRHLPWRVDAEKVQKAKAAGDFKQATAAAIATGLPGDEMTARLADTMEVGMDDLAALAAERAQHVRDTLVDVGTISPNRLFLTKASAGGTTAETGKGPRVFFQLR